MLEKTTSIIFILFFIFGSLLFWNILKTRQQQISSTSVKTLPTRAQITSSTYNPVIFKVLTSSSVSIQGSTLNNPYFLKIYQYIGLEKKQLPLIDSMETPHTNLPLFSNWLLSAKFPNGVVIENGDIITHAYYAVSNIKRAVNPLAAVYFVYYESCLKDVNGENVCWTGSNYCNYPITPLNSNAVITNMAEALAYARQTVDNNVDINPSNGCFYVTIDKNLVNNEITQQLTQSAPVFVNPFTLQINTQIRDRTLTLCTSSYVVNYEFTDIDPDPTFYDFYVDYGDGSPIEHHVGVFGTSNPITHTYASNATLLVQLKIIGYLPSWSCTAMSYGLPSMTPMTRDVISWGNVSLTYVDFFPEYNLRSFSAGSPPSTVKGMCFFFPADQSGRPNAWANLNTWNVDNVEYGISMFRVKQLGVLDLRGWRLPKLRYAAYMFIQVSIPIIGNLKDMTFESLEYADYMFSGFQGGPIDLSNANMSSLKSAQGMFVNFNSAEFDVSRFYTPNLRLAQGMFKQTDRFPNINVTFWTTTNLQDISEMFFGCNGTHLQLTNWNMQNIASCTRFIQSSNEDGLRQIDINTDYSQILIDFNSKTTTLICDWGLSGFSKPLRINGNATSPAGLTAKTNLINRGWTIVDLN
jgi:hypothetical protein